MTQTESVGLKLEQVERVYEGPPKVAALRAVNLQVRPGDFLAITGPSGAGKSTLLNILGLLDTPSRGRYLIDGTNVVGLPSADRDALRARTFGFVFQSSFLLSGRTVAANVALGLTIQGVARKDRGERVRQALSTVGIAHRWSALGRDLSGGEKQRVALARALVTHPSIVLADEPTGNLDSTNTANVIKLFQRVNAAGTTVIVITHTTAVAEASSRRAHILDGVLVDDAH